ncbi:MAG: MFS transporter [Actinobacteria bacterium]|nr:MFS transporter [Actinomycetota bacterium]
MPVKSLVRTLQAATFFLAASYGVMFTMLDDYRDEYGISESFLGLIVAMGFFSSFIGQLSLAPLADRGHAKRLLVVGFTAQIAGLLLMAYGTTAVLLSSGRLLMGIGAGMAMPALRRIVIVADPENLGTNMGRLLSVDVAGFATGPVLAVLTVDRFGIAAPYLILVVAIIAVSLALANLPIPETAVDDQPSERLALDLLRNRGVLAAVLIGVALFLMIGTFDSLWAVMMEDLEAPSWMANTGVALFVLPMIVLGPYGGRLAQRVGPYKTGAIGMLVGALCMTLYGFLPEPGLMMGVFFLHIVNDGFTVTSAGVAVGIAAPAERQAGAQGLLGGMQTLTGGIAASLAGWSYDSFGRGTTFLTTAVIMLVLISLGYSLAGDHRTSRPVETASLASTH